MKVRHSKKPLPRDWQGLPGAGRAILIQDIQVTRSSRLRLKLLVFRTPRDLSNFWKHGLGRGGPGRHCIGAVNGLASEIIGFPKGKPETHRMQVDPRYFAVMGLTAGNLDVEVVCHEATHAGFCYAKRMKRDMWPDSREMCEEQVCYPAGIIARKVAVAIKEAGL